MKIAIVGPLPKQQKIIEQRVKNAKLKFVDSERTLPTAADCIVIWTNFVSHKTQNAAVKLVGRDRVKLYTGGLGGLKKLIEGMAA